MAVTASSGAMDSSPSSTSLNGLDGINFFLAGMQSGFGPFVAVLLADEKWSQQNIGFVLSLGGFAGLLSQLPAGELLDATRSKRFLIALGGTVVAVSAILIALRLSAFRESVSTRRRDSYLDDIDYLAADYLAAAPDLPTRRDRKAAVNQLGNPGTAEAARA